MLPVVLSSQQNIEFTKENFPDKKSELKTALKNLEKGNSYYLADDYIKYLSLDYYLKAYSFNPNNTLLNYRLGNAFLHAANKTRALEYLKKAFQMNPDIDSAITFYLGEASHLNHDFDNAIAYYNLYKSSSKRHVIMGKNWLPIRFV
jgi:tetratricopeptide (TPR) repeat protein